MGVSVYEALGVREVISCRGPSTVIGNSLVRPEVLEVMAEASKASVDMSELLAAAGRRVATLTGAEAAYVTSGAAAALLLSTAACVTGKDPAKIARIPDTRGMKNEVVMHTLQRMDFDHAIRTAGVTIVEIGNFHAVSAWELESAINPNTAAAVYVVGLYPDACLPPETVMEVAHRAAVPVIVDCQALPPASNLTKFTKMGADLVCFSGSKALRGPGGSGIILGRKDLIEACALNSTPFHNTIGRPLKIGKEEVVGLVKALELYVARDHEADRREWERSAQYVVDQMAKLPHVKSWLAPGATPTAWVKVDEQALGLTTAEAAAKLEAGSPSIWVKWSADGIAISPITWPEDAETTVVRRLTEVLG